MLKPSTFEPGLKAIEFREGAQQMFFRGDSPKVLPLTLLCTFLDGKGTHFIYLLLTDGTTITYLP